MPLNVDLEGQTEKVFERIEKEWGELDILLHSIVFSPKEALHGRVIDVGRDGFLKTMDVSCWSFIRMAREWARNPGFLPTRFRLWTPALPNLRRRSPKVSGLFREYSRFGETAGGD